MASLDLIRAQQLLLQCRGDEIWSVETCRTQGIPETWIDELVDAHESGFDRESNTIYVDSDSGRPGELSLTNQYHGVTDLALAYKLAAYIGIDTEQATGSALDRTSQVRALKEALDEI